jgi:hypothetical protein
VNAKHMYSLTQYSQQYGGEKRSNIFDVSMCRDSYT